MKTIIIILLSCSYLLAQKFASIGDYGDAGSDELAVANLVKSWNPDFIITLGDNNYPDGEASTIDENIGQYYHQYIYPYVGSYGEGSDVNRFFPSLGNHDWKTNPPQPYFDYFILPNNERYYDFIWGDVHFFALDSDPDEPDGVSEDSIQGQWLQNALSSSTATWRVVYFHNTPYSSSSEPDHGSQEYMQWPFKEWGADVVMAAHDHTYERLIIDDFPYFVNGLGGKSKYFFGPPIPGSQVRYNEKYGAMLMTANESQFTFSFFSVDSELIDFYEIIRPNIPTNLAATVVSQIQIDLSWQDNSNNEDGFRIEWRLPPTTTWIEIATVGINVTTYQDTGLTANTEYCYRVRAYNTGGNSGYSNEDCATTNPTIPASPGNLTAKATGVNEVTLSWIDNSNNEDGFIIERENATLLLFAVIDSVGTNDTSYIDSTISQGVSYNYRISAFNISGQSGYSNVYYVTTILPAPTNLVGQLFGGPPYSVVLNWQDSSTNELGFVIERDTVGLGSFETLDSVAADLTFFEDTNYVNPVDTFYYRIYAFSQDTVSDYSNIAEMIIPVELVSFTANVFENSVTLSWITATEVNNLGFEVQRKLENSDWKRIEFVEGHGTTTEIQNYQFIDNISDIQATSLSYRLKQIDYYGSYEYSKVVEVSNPAPTDYDLRQNYPNPFNPVTTISYSLPVKSQVELVIYNTLGESVMQLVNGEKEAGNYEVSFSATNLPSGIYFYRLQVYPANGGAGSFVETKKMVLMK
jgi:hypothetical protein